MMNVPIAIYLLKNASGEDVPRIEQKIFYRALSFTTPEKQLYKDVKK